LEHVGQDSWNLFEKGIEYCISVRIIFTKYLNRKYSTHVVDCWLSLLISGSWHRRIRFVAWENKHICCKRSI
jgi:hypothetical protein